MYMKLNILVFPLNDFSCISGLSSSERYWYFDFSLLKLDQTYSRNTLTQMRNERLVTLNINTIMYVVDFIEDSG